VPRQRWVRRRPRRPGLELAIKVEEFGGTADHAIRERHLVQPERVTVAHANNAVRLHAALARHRRKLGAQSARAEPRVERAALKARRGGSGEGGGGGGLASRPTAQVSANTVDVRGEYAEAAIEEVERALSRATQYGALYVIHGHGTGRLREAVRVALREHPFVERLEDAPDNKGGRGCTVAFLRG